MDNPTFMDCLDLHSTACVKASGPQRISWTNSSEVCHPPWTEAQTITAQGHALQAGPCLLPAHIYVGTKPARAQSQWVCEQGPALPEREKGRPQQPGLIQGMVQAAQPPMVLAVRPPPAWLLPCDLLICKAAEAGQLDGFALDSSRGWSAATTRAMHVFAEPAMVFRHKPDEEGICRPCRRMFAVLKPDKRRCKFGDDQCMYCHHPAHFLADAPPTMRGTRPPQKPRHRRQRERELKRERKRQQMTETGNKVNSTSEGSASEDSKSGGTAKKPKDL